MSASKSPFTSMLVMMYPNNCFECPCFGEKTWRCRARMDIEEEVNEGRPKWCPLKRYEKAIPKSWIIEYIKNRVQACDGITEEVLYINDMLKTWEEDDEQKSSACY